jgi:hypothetical protein
VCAVGAALALLPVRAAAPRATAPR